MFHSVVDEEQRQKFAKSPLSVAGAQLFHKLGGKYAICNYREFGEKDGRGSEVLYSTESGAIAVILSCYRSATSEMGTKSDYTYVLQHPKFPISAAFTSVLVLQEHASSNNPAYVIRSVDRGPTRKKAPLMTEVTGKLSTAWGNHVKDGLFNVGRLLHRDFAAKFGSKGSQRLLPSDQQTLMDIVFGGMAVESVPAHDIARIKNFWEQCKTENAAGEYSKDTANQILSGEKWVISYVQQDTQATKRGYYIVGVLNPAFYAAGMANCIQGGHFPSSLSQFDIENSLFTVKPRMYASLEDVPNSDELMGALTMAKHFLSHSGADVRFSLDDGVVPFGTAADADTGILLSTNQSRHIYMVPK